MTKNIVEACRGWAEDMRKEGRILEACAFDRAVHEIVKLWHQRDKARKSLRRERDAAKAWPKLGVVQP